MTIENGAEQAANDITLANQSTQQPAATDNADLPEGEDREGEEGQQQEPEDEEVDYEGQKYRLPKNLKDALLRQADYTRKTQEHAEHRKTFEAEKETWTKSQESQRAHFQEAVKIAGFDERLGGIQSQLKQYESVNWPAAYQAAAANGTLDNYHQHKAVFDQLMSDHINLSNQRNTAVRDWTQKEQERESNANRTRGERIAQVQAELPKLIEGWTPELDVKMMQYGTANGLSQKEMAEAVLQNPKFAPMLHKAMLYDEQQKKQKTQQTFDQQQQAKPVTRVGGNGGSAQRKTTDASGDALSTDEWAKRERERMRKRA